MEWKHSASICFVLGVKMEGEYLECPITNKDNCKVVEEFRNEIIWLVPKLKEELENLNYEDFERRLLYVVGCAWHRVDSP